MTRIFLAPRSNETSNKNFKSTILAGVPYEFLEPYLDEQEKQIIESLTVVRVWGNKESLRSRWEKMQPGDVILFYGKGVFYYSARVLLTKFNPELARELWGPDEEGRLWSCLFFVSKPKDIKIPIKVIQELAEYEPTWDRVQGFMPLSEEGVKAIEEKFGSVESFVNQDSETLNVIGNIIENSKDEVLEEQPLEVVDKKTLLEQALSYKASGEGYALNESPHMVRVENREQKKRIAELENHKCQVCGWSMVWQDKKGNARYRIDVDHIIDKSKGGTEVASNLWALCPNCHAEKTLGVITVDLKNHKVFRNKLEIQITDNHLNWDKT